MKKDWKKIKSKIQAFLILFIIIAIIMLMFKLDSDMSLKLYMDNLNYDITLHENGDMTIVETWDMYISHTNTIFKTFELSNKFGDVTDVSVKDLKTGKELVQIDEEMYHVTTGCYYALEINRREFEVAWGTGMENKSGHKKYQLTYTITDAISDYKDCQELYWKLLAEENTIPVKNVTGTIKLPQEVSDIDKLKVWGHGPTNGDIQKIGNDLIQFTIEDFSANRMLEVRVVTAEDIFEDVTQVKNYNYLKRILAEEEEWADKTNADAIGFRTFMIILGIIYVIIIIKNIVQTIKYRELSKRKNDGIIKTKLEYYRDIPRENDSTPAEATYLYRFNKNINGYTRYQSDMFAATILDLCLKKCISLRTAEDNVYVKVEKVTCKLKEDEEVIYKLLKEVSENGEEFNIEELNEYAKKHYDKYSSIINKMVNSARESLYDLNLVDKANEKEYAKSKNAEGKFWLLKQLTKIIIIFLILACIPLYKVVFISILGMGYLEKMLILSITLMPYIVVKLIKFKVCASIKNKIAVLTQEGYDEKEQWKGLKNYIENYSLLKEKEVSLLPVWEKYLVYATAFGIADKAIEQMKANYPEVFVEEYWKDENNNQYEIIKFVASNNYVRFSYSPINTLHSNVTRAYKTSRTEISRHSSSSGSGGGGGFSSGGGGRRRWRPEWEEDKNELLTRYDEYLVFL